MKNLHIIKILLNEIFLSGGQVKSQKKGEDNGYRYY